MSGLDWLIRSAPFDANGEAEGVPECCSRGSRAVTGALACRCLQGSEASEFADALVAGVGDVKAVGCRVKGNAGRVIELGGAEDIGARSELCRGHAGNETGV